MTTSRPGRLFTLVGSVLFVAAMAAPAAGQIDAGPDADMDADFDSSAPGDALDINDPALDKSDCRIAAVGQRTAPLPSLIVLVGVLFIARRMRE